MNNKRFQDFVESQAPSKPESKFDPASEIKQWKSDLLSLYETIKTYIKPYMDTGRITVTMQDTTLSEESLGSYVVPSMIIQLGNNRFKLNPIGTMLIGSRGRVDVIGPRGQFMLVMVREGGPHISVKISILSESEKNSKPSSNDEEDISNIHWVWMIRSKVPPYKLYALEEDAFLDAMMDIAGA